jgi:uncharacterized membrane protein YkoI
MRGILGCVAAGAVMGLLLTATATRADDKKDEKKKAEKLTADKLPKVIRDAVQKRFPGAEITSAEKETEDGKVVYDIELKHNGRKYEMDIKEDGTVIEIEKEVDLKDVPAAVTRAVGAKYPNSTIKEVMEVNKVNGTVETPIHYEITIETAEKKKMEVIVSLDGKSVKAEGEK